MADRMEESVGKVAEMKCKRQQQSQGKWGSQCGESSKEIVERELMRVRDSRFK
jgi:hypothetical protein